ncbi:MAG: hypothetical protein EAZ40_15740, partial [Rhodobacterales bacterium]
MPMTRSHRLVLAALFAVLAAAGGCDEATPEGEAVTVPSGRASVAPSTAASPPASGSIGVSPSSLASTPAS